MIKHYRNYTLYLLIICSFFCYGQQNSVADTLVKKQTLLLKKMIIPLSLTASALAINNSKFEEDLQPRINRDLTTNIDDYTRYVPLAAIYIADGFGVPAQNHWFDQTKNAALSLIITQLVTKGLKANIDKERPNGEDNRAFPSGHTSAAFASATLLFEEFRDSAPILA
ncbi:MAG: hypothetical protein KJO90_00365, partial [Eudoraea sp.]|nr:hypothetical protein [Eudoraea sp.]